MSMVAFLARLACDRAGSMAIETALVVPVLALMSIGSFEISGMVARQSELQSAAAEAAQIALASSPTTDAQKRTVEEIIIASTRLPDAQVTLTWRYRCGTDAALVSAATSCDPSDKVSSYLRIYMTDTYTPTWTEFGVGAPLTYRLARTVQLS